jgi:hypothetical protein
MSGLVFLLAALTPGQSFAVDYPQEHGDVHALLRVEVPEEGAVPGRSRLLLTLTFTGPAGLEVQGPTLEDALAGWRVTRRASSWRQDGQGVHWSLSLHLEQVKPGQVPPPGVVVRIRTAPAATWERLAWLDLLSEPRDVRPPDYLPPLPAPVWPARLRLAGVSLVCALAVLLAVRALQRRLRPRRIVTPAARALARLEPPNLPPSDRLAERFAHVEAVVRDYLDEQRGLKTRQQTTREVLSVLGELPADAQDALRELFERGELVKFAGQAPSAEECDRAVEQARQVVRACAVATVPGREAVPATEPGKDASAG